MWKTNRPSQSLNISKKTTGFSRSTGRRLRFESLEGRAMLSISPIFPVAESAFTEPSQPTEIQAASAIPQAGNVPLEAGLPATYSYVVITNSELASSFQPLLAEKAGRGLTVASVTTDYIYANYAATESHANDSEGQAGINADKIRSFIRDSYQNHGTRWVLLGGDVEVVPQRNVYVYASPGAIVTDLPTDEYYACLTGPWNSNGNSNWGEINDGTGGADINFTPQVYVGRAPVSNATETVNFVNKTIQYETTTAPNAKQVVLWGDQLDASNYGSASGIDIRDTVLPAAVKAQIIESYDAPGYTASMADRINELNASPNIIEHLGHGNATTNAHLTIDQVESLTNSFPFFMYSQACDSGAFDASDSIAEHYVTAAHGAFAVIMNSRLGWYDTAGGLDYSHLHAKAFMDEIFNHGTLRLGEANEAAKADMRALVGKNGYYRWIELEANLLGDPETSMQIGNTVAYPGVTIAQSGGSTNVVESGATDSYTVVLNAIPTANVTITVATSSQLAVDKKTLTFTPGNWNVPQTVTVSAADDFIVQGPHTGTIAHQLASSDSRYNGLTAAGVTVNIADYVAAVRTWTGNAADNRWATAANWQGGVAPHPTDQLVFPEGRQNRSFNDFAANTVFASLTFKNSTSLVLDGNSVVLNPSNGIAMSSTGSGLTQLNLSIALGTDSSFAFGNAQVKLAGGLDYRSHDLTILSGKLDLGIINAPTSTITVQNNTTLNAQSIVADSLIIGGASAGTPATPANSAPSVSSSPQAAVSSAVGGNVSEIQPKPTPTKRLPAFFTPIGPRDFLSFLSGSWSLFSQVSRFFFK